MATNQPEVAIPERTCVAEWHGDVRSLPILNAGAFWIGKIDVRHPTPHEVKFALLAKADSELSQLGQPSEP